MTTISTNCHWIIEGRDGYHTCGFQTKKEAIFRLNEIANEPFYNCGLSIKRRAIDFIEYSDGTIFRIVKF
jgi:hypothetical protein